MEAYGVIDEAGKFYIFGGIDINFFKDMIIFDTVTSTWSKGSTINAPLPRVDYTATLLSNGIIVFIGGREKLHFVPEPLNHRTADEYAALQREFPGSRLRA